MVFKIVNYHPRPQESVKVHIHFIKPDKDSSRKEYYKPVVLMNTDSKILHKILGNQIQGQYIKRLVYHHQLGLIPGIKDWLSFPKSIDVIHHMNSLNNKKHMIMSMAAEKTFHIIQHSFMRNAASKPGRKGNFLNPKKGHLLKIYS